MNDSALERWALAAAERSETELVIASVLVAFLGFLAALVLRRGAGSTLSRAPYFLLSSFLYLLSSLVTLAWLWSPEAAIHGLFWLLVVCVAGLVAGLGFAYGIIAHARSMSAYETGWFALLAFVPLINLALFLTSPKEKAEATTAGQRAAGIAMVLLGFGVFASGKSVERMATRAVDDMAAKQASTPEANQRTLEAMLKAQGIAAVLEWIAASSSESAIDEVTVMEGLTADGATLRYRYRVDADLESVPRVIRESLARENCSADVIRTLVDAGASVEHVFRRADGDPLGVVRITRDACELVRLNEIPEAQ